MICYLLQRLRVSDGTVFFRSEVGALSCKPIHPFVFDTFWYDVLDSEALFVNTAQYCHRHPGRHALEEVQRHVESVGAPLEERNVGVLELVFVPDCTYGLVHGQRSWLVQTLCSESACGFCLSSPGGVGVFQNEIGRSHASCDQRKILSQITQKARAS